MEKSSYHPLQTCAPRPLLSASLSSCLPREGDWLCKEYIPKQSRLPLMAAGFSYARNWQYFLFPFFPFMNSKAFPALENSAVTGNIPPGPYLHNGSRVDVCTAELSGSIDRIVIDGITIFLRSNRTTLQEILRIVQEHTASLPPALPMSPASSDVES